MNSTDDSTPDPLMREYQRASSTEAGQPSDATRAAILADARAAALRRMPAANNSRFVWRAVASVAVLGVAVLLWRQAGQPLSVTARVEPPTARREAPKPIAAPATTAAVVAAESAAVAPATLVDAAPTARSAAEANATVLLRQALPAAYYSATPPTTTWVLQDKDGTILRKGGLDASQTLESVRTELTMEFPDRRIGPWVVSPVSNSRGATLRLGVARMD
jgi:hypothetical protein